MAYLIDGNNLLGFLYAGFHRDPAHRAALVRKLQTFQRRTRTRLILVFDGPEPAGFPAPEGDKFQILFPPSGETADSVLAEAVERRRDRRRLIVVSSDREVRDFARAAGAVSKTSEEFARELKRALRESREAREMDKDEAAATALEVRLWSEAFARRRT